MQYSASTKEASGVVVRNVTKSYGSLKAVSNLNLDIERGTFLTLFGPNGAGKTTLIKMLALLTKPSSGSISVFGHDASKEPNSVRAVTGVISHDPYLYPGLTALENIVFFARMQGVRRPKDRAQEVIAMVGLEGRMNDLVRSFSRGMQQRLAVARAMVNDPMVLLLDEPYAGLDQHGAELFSGLLRWLKDKRRTIVMTTHNVSEGLGMSDRVIIMSGGRIVYDEAGSNIGAAEFRNIYLEMVRG
ncbi:MAG: ABC transporter ATP-binding protein [Candidatus Methanosuratincola sp.]|jgi:ABC-type multidrug transport system ATPase subunit